MGLNIDVPRYYVGGTRPTEVARLGTGPITHDQKCVMGVKLDL